MRRITVVIAGPVDTLSGVADAVVQVPEGVQPSSVTSSTSDLSLDTEWAAGWRPGDERLVARLLRAASARLDRLAARVEGRR